MDTFKARLHSTAAQTTAHSHCTQSTACPQVQAAALFLEHSPGTAAPGSSEKHAACQNMRTAQFWAISLVFRPVESQDGSMSSSCEEMAQDHVRAGGAAFWIPWQRWAKGRVTRSWGRGHVWGLRVSQWRHAVHWRASCREVTDVCRAVLRLRPT